MKTKETWDLGRFLRTIAYFDAIPFLDCFPWLKNKLLNMDSTPVSPSVGHRRSILVLAANESLGGQIVDRLQQDNYVVRVLVEDLSRAQSLYSDREILLSNRVTPELLIGVEAIVICGQNSPFGREKEQEVIKAIARREETKILFDFTRPSEDLRQSWGAVDDVVMGGVSESQIVLVSTALNDREGFAVFSGIVSTANSGGFASVRHRNFQPPLNLSAYEGIQLQVKGDGKRYKFIARCEGNWDGVSYCYSFDTVADEWISVRIPFAELIPVFRAKTLTDVGAFDARRTYSLQLMLSKFEYDRALNPTFTPGSFTLQVKDIITYGGKNSPPLVGIGSQVSETSLPITHIDRDRFADEKAIAEHCLSLLHGFFDSAGS